LISFDPERSAFGRHETFPLRFGWLTKGFSAWNANPQIFENEDATVELGVGKNMVNAIRYWMTAAQVLEVTNKKKVAVSALGTRMFGKDGWDPYLEDDATIWLIHWLIASNATEATSIFWFFNRFHKPEFTAAEMQAALSDFVSRDVRSRATASTIKHDVNLLLRMYERSEASKVVPLEETLDSPLSMLGLLRHSDGSRFHESRPEARPHIPLAAFAFSVLDVFNHSKAAAVPIEALLHSDGTVASPGSAFRLNEEGLIAKIEQLIAWQPNGFDLRETAGVRQLYKNKGAKSGVELLRLHYERGS
jgi:hypothetical protein